MTGLRFGLIGASDIAATRIVPALRRTGHKVVGVLSSSRERGATYAAANDIAFATTELDALLARDDVDAVYVSTTNELHREQTLAAAAAGKHVLCEKPLALSVADAWEMVDACERAGVVLATNHHLPAAGTHRAIRDVVAGGAVGEPMAVRVFHAVSLPERLRGWRLSSPERGAGVILDVTCHDAAAIHAILGRRPERAAAVAVTQGPWDAAVEDAVVTALRYGGDVLVQTHDAFTVAHAATGLEVHGSEGSIVATDVMTQDPVGRVVLRTASGEREIEPPDRRDLYDVALEAFAAAARGTARPLVDGVDGVRTLGVALAVKEAAESGRTVPVAFERATA
jgi:1,5-anhydro-D-fructose reductase (1,5-anhydro-D-mannitol-forming)